MPVQEYCFLWIDWWAICMNKAEWSGWTQAFGSVGAIVGAAWISTRQERNTRWRAKQLAIRKARSALAGLLAVAELVREKGSLWLADAAPKRRLVEEHLGIARSIEAEQLQLNWAVQVLALRSAGVQLVSALEGFERSKSRPNHPGLAELAAHDALMETVREVESSLLNIQTFIREEHPGVQAYQD